MIPKIIHYVWLGGAEIPTAQQTYINGWCKIMPDWEIIGWTETNIPIEVLAVPYVKQAYEARKFAFVSDYVRLWALEQYGGVYLDTDVEIIRSFDELPEFNLQSTISNQQYSAFIGFEESLAQLPGTCVMGCEAHCLWVREMLKTYEGAQFIKEDGSYDMTTNVMRMGMTMVEKYGLARNGQEQYLQHLNLSDLPITEGSQRFEIVHVYDHHHFSPITSTRVMRKNKDTYAIHHFAGSWTGDGSGHWYDHPACREVINAMIQVKRWLKRIGKTSLLEYTEKYELED